MRWIVALLLLLPVAMACLGPGYTCDRGAVEIHVPVNVLVAKKALVEANVIPAGQAWGVSGEVRVFYGREYPILLYIWPKGVRIQVAVKGFERNGTSEHCEFYVDPRELNVKDVVKRELVSLREKGVVNIAPEQVEEVVKLAGWGLAGNQWLVVNEGVKIEGVRGCKEWPVFVLKEWKKGEQRAFPPWTVLVVAALLLLFFSLRRR